MPLEWLSHSAGSLVSVDSLRFLQVCLHQARLARIHCTFAEALWDTPSLLGWRKVRIDLWREVCMSLDSRGVRVLTP